MRSKFIDEHDPCISAMSVKGMGKIAPGGVAAVSNASRLPLARLAHAAW